VTRRLQLEPPFVVLYTVPLEPTIVPAVALVKETDMSVLAAPVNCGVQILPPSVVRSVVPSSPTIVPVVPLINATP
jgi:hypothetical protein